MKLYPNRIHVIGIIFVALSLFATDAFAIDGYKSRRNIFWGFGLGGGAGMTALDADNIHQGLDRDRQMGMHLSAILGGGAYENLLVGGELNWWIHKAQLNDEKFNHQHLSFNGVVNFFLIGGWYLDAGVGMAYANYEAMLNDQSRHSYKELGLATKAGTGFEFFVNATVAAGINFGYTRHFYQDSSFDTIKGGLTVRWY